MGQAQPTFPFGGWVVLKSHVSKSRGMLCLKSVYYCMWAHRSSCLCLIGRKGIASDCWRVIAHGLHLLLMCSCQVVPFGPWACPWVIGHLYLGSFLLVFFVFLAQIHLHTFSDQHLWNSSNNHPMLTFIPSDDRLLHDSWWSKWDVSDRQQGSSGQQLFQMQKNLSDDALGANSWAKRLTS